MELLFGPVYAELCKIETQDAGCDLKQLASSSTAFKQSTAHSDRLSTLTWKQ
jgi:hypothetical protein